MTQEIAKIKVSEIYSGYNDGDSVVGYEEIDEPLRDTGVIHGDFNYRGSIIEDEELLTE